MFAQASQIVSYCNAKDAKFGKDCSHEGHEEHAGRDLTAEPSCLRGEIEISIGAPDRRRYRYGEPNRVAPAVTTLTEKRIPR